MQTYWKAKDRKSNKLYSLKYFPIVEKEIYIESNPIRTLKGLQNVSTNLLIALIMDYEKLDWKDIEWDKVKNLNEIVTNLYENIEKDCLQKESQEALRRIEELQLY